MCNRLTTFLVLLLLRCALRLSSATTDLITLFLTIYTLLTELKASIAAQAPTATTATAVTVATAVTAAKADTVAATLVVTIAIVVDKLVATITAEEASWALVAQSSC
jgi:hypothetical protein